MEEGFQVSESKAESITEHPIQGGRALALNVHPVPYWLCDIGSRLTALYPSLLICKVEIIIIITITTAAPTQAGTWCSKPESSPSGLAILIGARDLQPVTQ